MSTQNPENKFIEKQRKGPHIKKSTDDPRNRATRRSDERFDRLNPERLRKQKISIQRKESKEEGRKIQMEKIEKRRLSSLVL